VTRSISFLTDYGLADGFVAACHGVIAAIAPDARVLDVTHLVPPQDVRRGAAVLAETVAYLPAGVHLAVVDPGVGTSRRAVVLAGQDRVFVGPDNGLLIPAAELTGGVRAAHAIADPRLWRHPVSRTFHGRDVFAPVAAYLARGVPPSAVGPSLDPATLVRLPEPVRHREGDGFVAEVVTVDGFGNAQIAAGPGDLDLPAGGGVLVEAAGRRHALRYAAAFADVPAGAPLLFVDSGGRLALAVNGGSAAAWFGVRPGDLVRLAPVPPRGTPRVAG
jgi:S-adenosylmethionine hydrolase